MKFRFHWGWAIGMFYTFFVIAMVYMVFYSKTVDHTLERDNYYDYDIGYEKLIGEKMRNSNSLSNKVRIEYEEAGKSVNIFFPKEFNGISGEIWFYRVNNQKLDLKIPVSPDSLHVQKIDVSDFAGGKWKVSVDWQSLGKNYLDSNNFYFK
ncbi:MAG: FixH family protein [Saprospiraceae bacterium]|nr:FixH family protein [Saprospiraceae bacterium]